MTLIAQPARHPRLPGQQAEVAPGSPLAVLAIFAEIARERFRSAATASQLPWYWNDNPTPAANEDNQTDFPRKILIEPSFSVATEARNFVPAIYVDRLATSPNKSMLNNFVGQRLPDTKKGFMVIADIPIEFECVSDERMESAQIADILWMYLLSGIEQMRETFGFYEILPPSLSRTAPYAEDKTKWATKVQLDTKLTFRWVTTPIASTLRDFVTKYQQSGSTDIDSYLLQQYVNANP